MIKLTPLILITSLFFIQPASTASAIDSQSGLIIDTGYKAVKQHCSSCHSPKVFTQNQASRQGWLEIIRWMQKEQGMPLLNKQSEKIILNYLSKNYASTKKSRRAPLNIKNWIKF